MDVYLDQIVEGTNEQNVGTVFALLEVAVTWISANVPFTKHIVLQTDNAKCYQSNALRLLIGFTELSLANQNNTLRRTLKMARVRSWFL